MIEAVVFDYGGVLSTAPFLNFGAVEGALDYPRGALRRLFFGENPDSRTVVDDETRRDWHTLETGGLAMAEFLDRMRRRAPLVLDGRPFDPDALFRELGRTSSGGTHWMVVHAVRDLRARGLRTAICTNNIREWRPVWEETVPIEWFDAVVDSSEVGHRKPDPDIYLITCARLGVAPERAVFLDDVKANVAGAEAVGMHGIHVERDPRPALAELERLLSG